MNFEINDSIKKGLGVALVVFLLDQISKVFLLEVVNLSARQVIEITSFFNLVMVWNKGISFGMFNDVSYSHYIFSAIAVLIVIFLIFWLQKPENSLQVLSLGLIIGGAVGNLIDRLRFQAVVDFLDFHIMGYHWPAFNIADAAISIGAGLLIISILIGNKEKDKKLS